MNRRPLSVTLISWIFIAMGMIALGYHLMPQHIHEAKSLLGISVVRVIPIVSGIAMLRGFNWGRWVIVLWLAYHVVLSAFHSASQVAVHGLLLALVTYFLFRSRATAYFGRRSVEAPEPLTPP